MKKFLLITILILVSNPLFASTDVTSSASLKSMTREQLMDREMGCLANRMAVRQEIDWQDVCYTDEKADQELKNRDEKIARTLDHVVNEHEGLFEGQQSEDMYNKTADQFYDDWGGASKEPKTKELQKKSLASSNEAVSSSSMNDQEKNIENEKDEWDEVLNSPDKAPKSKYADRMQSPKQAVELGTEYYTYDYEEPLSGDDGPNFARIRGNFYGVFLNYTARPDEDDAMHMDVVDYYRVETRFASGLDLDYDSYGSGSDQGFEDYVFEIRGMAGKDFSPYALTRLTPYVGLAFRYLNDDSSGRQTTTGAFGYERESRYFYAPFGALLEMQISSSLKIGITGEYDFFINGTQKSHLSDVAAIYGDVENTQDRGVGYRTSMKITRMGNRFNLMVEPFFRYWHIKDSNIAVSSTGVIAGLEPENKTHEVGIKFGAEF